MCRHAPVCRLLCCLGWLCLWSPGAAAQAESAARVMAERQARLLDEIALDFRATADVSGRRTMSPRVETALREVPRHEFVPADSEEQAYLNRPLIIGHGQTISQPFIVALMTELLDLEPGDRVLEIGTGSGYQAAVLARLADQVYTIEIVEPLGVAARERLARLGYGNVSVRIGDGNRGWPEAAPFDAIIVTAGGRVPPALLEQLGEGGRLVIPVDVAPGDQELRVYHKDASGEVSMTPSLPVRFVPLTGDNPPRPAAP